MLVPKPSGGALGRIGPCWADNATAPAASASAKTTDTGFIGLGVQGAQMKRGRKGIPFLPRLPPAETASLERPALLLLRVARRLRLPLFDDLLVLVVRQVEDVHPGVRHL